MGTRNGRILSILGIVLTIGLAVGGFQYFSHERATLTNLKRSKLRAVANLKTQDITRWREDRLKRVDLDSTGLIHTLVLSWLEQPDDAERKEAALSRMNEVRTTYEYANVIITRPDASVLLAVDQEFREFGPQARSLVEKAASQGGPAFGELFTCPSNSKVLVDVAAPILDSQKRTVAVLVERIDTQAFLYPFLRSWPGPSRSAETILVRAVGTDAVLLSPSRHRSEPPLTTRIPLTRDDVVTVRAALGFVGELDGLDYRGVSVLGHVQPVEDSPWVLMTKVDKDEILAEFMDQGWITLIVFILLLQLVIALLQMVNTARKLSGS